MLVLLEYSDALLEFKANEIVYERIRDMEALDLEHRNAFITQWTIKISLLCVRRIIKLFEPAENALEWKETRTNAYKTLSTSITILDCVSYLAEQRSNECYSCAFFICDGPIEVRLIIKIQGSHIKITKHIRLISLKKTSTWNTNRPSVTNRTLLLLPSIVKTVKILTFTWLPYRFSM